MSQSLGRTIFGGIGVPVIGRIEGPILKAQRSPLPLPVRPHDAVRPGSASDSTRNRFRLLEGISPEVVEMLKDTPCSMKVFDLLRQINAVRQIDAADLIVGQHNFTLEDFPEICRGGSDN
ncbi:plasmid partitioning protein RepB C-terminal domain-containing protein [Sinorhizobium meliloti]|uniref:plasmid partitioning protein RepB C-terminal domain-containing protein n=1 Tax=Rhizobium meliloti TaxID=382 RepID=UPI00398CC6DD